jgi:pimeloyl-ACP methyl ester carboxylesterase
VRIAPYEHVPAGPSAYVLTRRDVVVRPDWQARAARELLGVEPVELDAGHFPMITHPVELADVLERLA